MSVHLLCLMESAQRVSNERLRGKEENLCSYKFIWFYSI